MDVGDVYDPSLVGAHHGELTLQSIRAATTGLPAR